MGVVRARHEYPCYGCGELIAKRELCTAFFARYEPRHAHNRCFPSINLPRQGRPRLGNFHDLYIPEPNSGCWLWTGPAYDTGYGVFFNPRIDRRDGAHRVSMELATGEPIPPGMQVNHHCDVRACVNPDHLYIGTQKDNMRDACDRGRSNVPGLTRGYPRMNAAKTHCKHGHEFTPENTATARRKNGKMRRECVTCRRRLVNAYNRRRRSANLSVA